MSAPVISVREDTPLVEVARLMTEHRIGGVPVVRGDGRLVGVITESDFAAKERGIPFSLLQLPQLFGHWLSRNNLEAIYDEARDITAGQVMTRNVVSVGEDDPVESAARKMCEDRVHRLPVLRGGVPVGIVARHDLLRVMLHNSPSAHPQAAVV
jgi:CBS domain-containing protein